MIPATGGGEMHPVSPQMLGCWPKCEQSKLDMSCSAAFLFYLFRCLFIYFGLREHKQGRGREREREGDRESKAGSRLRTVSTEPDVGLELTNREIVT